MHRNHWSTGDAGLTSTESYLFFTAKDWGITASLAIPPDHGSDVTKVVVFNLLLQDVTRFTTRQHPTSSGQRSY